ncbi:helix-turn-helix transcriptional regulator [Megasphaera vaginalis (ex Srinivasan et al. 2021)]|uniref:YheO-like protein n=1 Tax=Megasphaera vaginalis (ex Srinivasan et al. 2021) TaxID=1111454 RepID=U7USI6_9FIRM|nr:PAS domain-containing protein [Megasphaera vaginalis (ex Srinivasan et al. 2021)]ERT62412.1 YheO-like protein [Megasphaera vaginalis (ex Srinivasan et al. 2021)]
MDTNNTLVMYEKLVAFLGEVLGDQCEVVLHDMRNLEHSVIAIANGQVSGREVGCPATDFVLKLLQLGKDKRAEYITNYFGKNKDGQILRSSSYFIHDDAGKVLGVLCINYNLQEYLRVRDALDNAFLLKRDKQSKMVIHSASENNLLTVISENLSQTADETIDSIISKELMQYAVDPKRFSQKERLAVVKNLYDNGLFLLKGGIGALARRLGVSEPTVYRYINTVKNG